MKGLTIGYTANIKDPISTYDRSYDEWETLENVTNVVKALEFTGNRVIVINADKNAFYELDKYKNEIDIVFNNAEGLPEVESRESTMPTILELLRIPYTGSNPQALANALDKVTTREILTNYGINNLPFQRFESYAQKLKDDLRFPLIVKPASEGSSIGLSQHSIVENGRDLYRAVKKILDTYGRSVIAEEYIDGREYTIGLIGNLVLPPLSFNSQEIPGNPKLRDYKVKHIDVGFCKVLTEFDEIYQSLAAQTIVAHHAIGCDDYNRIDYRVKDGKVYFIEMNPLPGLHPTESDLPLEARAAGIDYNTMISMMLYEAIKRNRENKNYSHIFLQEKTEMIENYVNSEMKKILDSRRVREFNILERIEGVNQSHKLIYANQ